MAISIDPHQENFGKQSRVLMLTDMPACDNYTAGIVTGEICRAMARDQLAMFCVLNRHLKPNHYRDLAWIPLRTVTKPMEVGRRSIRGWKLPSLLTVIVELAKRWIVVPRLVRQAVAFGREQNVTAVWAVLQGQTLVRMALPLAKALDVPLLVQVWDPLGWWLKEHLVDDVNRRLDLDLFDQTLRSAAGCASASWAMSEAYLARYGISGEPLLAAIDPSVACPPALGMRSSDEVVVGVAGQFYAAEEWLELIRGLDEAHWQVAGKSVRLRVLGNYEPPGVIPAGRMEWIGWQPQSQAIRILAETCDVLYCGYPFAQSMREVAQQSFPSKLPTYFAAGRPVLFHGPPDSSPGIYLARRGAASMATRLASGAAYEALAALIEDPAFYRRIALAGRAAFDANFTPEKQADAVHRVLSLAEPHRGSTIRT